MQPQRKISPYERNLIFAQMTRQNIHDLPPIALTDNSTVSFSIPKTRLSSMIYLLVEGTYTVTHASLTTYSLARHAPYSWFRNIRVAINNGFTPYNISGAGASLLNLMSADNEPFIPVTGAALGRNSCAVSGTASAGGSVNTCRFVVPLSLAINSRDPIGLILTQNEEVNITVTIDTSTILAAILGSAAGFAVSNVNMQVFPHVEQFSIPAVPEGMPDLSTIKLVHEQIFDMPAAGENIIRLPVGTTYRRILIDCYHGAGAGVALADNEITNVTLSLNQADMPYTYRPRMLQHINQRAYGTPLPAGVFALDFATQGYANYGGSRDYIDTERLTEFWVELNTTRSGFVRVVYETLARLRGMSA